MNPTIIPRLADPTYDGLAAAMQWHIPDVFNMGAACADIAPPDAVALVTVERDREGASTTFGELSRWSGQLAAALKARGVDRGDRIGIVAPQSLETGLSHLAVWKLGAISLPLASLFGPDALRYRLDDAGARMALVSPENVVKVREAGPGIELMVMDDDFWSELQACEPIDSASTLAEDPAFLIYTSGTTGPPKGALHAHRALFGHLPAFELYYEYAPQPHDVIWTPADWAWIGGLMDVLVPAWYHGMTVLKAPHGFEPHEAVDLMVQHKVTCAFLPPTALKMMRAAGAGSSNLQLRAIFTGGEPLGAEMLGWAETNLGARVNEGYGQTEANIVVGNCASTWPVKPGSMGRPIPGHQVAVLDDEGNPAVGEVGELAVRAPDPVMMIEYWNQPEATAGKYLDGWLLTGDLGREDNDGYLWFVSRKDDIISSGGYRIGPGEIEESLMGHAAVAHCAVTGVPDEIRGQVPAAYVVLNKGFTSSDHLAEELQQHVRVRLAAHEVPRHLFFVAELPRTTTGKIVRRELRRIFDQA
ncbi:MAG: AMP-binding protein [Acidimicrobiia bacterium]|nr:AMP-binding protein [Acidimicrobiia bacterium]MDH5502534.1 AMP-binding protein [Acidimicrobiia bacterium]